MITSLRFKGTYELAYYLLDRELISLYRLSPIVPPSGVETFGNDTIAIER